MGILLSRVRKKKSTIETLEKLDNDIKEIEENRINAQRKYKKFTKMLLVYSLGLYVICGIIFYFQYTSTLKGKLLYLVPLAISPLILYIVKIIISWYYVRLINKNQIRLNEMKKEKKRILEEVMDKETYKVAKEILEKFSGETTAKPHNVQLVSTKSDDGLRKRLVPSLTSAPGQLPSNIGNIARNQAPRPILSSQTPLKPLSAPVNPMMRLPAPILPLQRNYLDRIVEYLIGDGVNNRYALICSKCHSHNGMALKEEFEYISFKCCYCFFFNPARKVRPEAPKLEGSLRIRQVSDSDSEKTSGESSDAEPKNQSDEKRISNLNDDGDVTNFESITNEKKGEDSEDDNLSTTADTENYTAAESSERKESVQQFETDSNCDQSTVKS